MPSNQDKTRSTVTIFDERISLPNSAYLAPGSYSVSNGQLSFPPNPNLSPPLVAATLPDSQTNNWNPGDISNVARIRVATAGSNATVTGLVGGSDGYQRIITVTSGTLTLLNENTGSTAANRFALNGDKVIPAGTSFMLIYDGALQRWSGIGA